MSAVLLGVTLCRQPDVSHEHTASIFRVEEQGMKKSAEAGGTFNCSLLSNTDDGSDVFRRNIGLSLNYKKVKFR
jgi:hypothetical protein